MDRKHFSTGSPGALAVVRRLTGARHMFIVHSLAGPTATGDAASAVVAAKYFERVVHQVHEALSRCGLDREAECLTSIPAERCWRPEIGLARRACAEGNTQLAALQLLVVGDGKIPMRIDTELPQPGRLLVDGEIVELEGVVVLRLDHVLTIECGERRAQFSKQDDRWLLSTPPSRPRWRVHGLSPYGPSFIVESDIQGTPALFPDLARTRKPPPGESTDDMDLGPIREAIDLISANPSYAGLLASVVRGFIVTRGERSPANSSREMPGLVALKSADEVLGYVESIVAAACHQALFQMSLAFALTESGREHVGYVATRRTYMTARRALAAAHEHVNVARLLESLSSDAQTRARASRRRLLIATDCAPLLDRSKNLTAAGSQLWTALKAMTDVAPCSTPSRCPSEQ